MGRVYHRRGPAAVRKLLYPDAFTLNALAGRGIHAEVTLHSSGVTVPTPEAPSLGVWDQVPIRVAAEYTTPDMRSATLSGALYNPWHNLVTSHFGAPLIDSTSTVLPIDKRALTGRFRWGRYKVSGPCTVFRSVHNNYFHTLIDNLARVFLLRQSCYENVGTLQMLFPTSPTEAEQFFLERYLPDNVEIVVVPDNQYIAPETLIFPCFLMRRTMTYLPPSYLQDMLPHFLPKRPRNKRHRIFISRRIGPRGELRVIRNESKLYERLKASGFVQYYLEDLSLSDQIELFYDAEVVVAAHGAGLSNLIFAENIALVELHPGKMIIPNYYYLCKSLGHQYATWKGNGGHFEDNFSVDIGQVVELLPPELRD
ncbi:MAG: glycosyltransferase family 61 protein [Proteobacteria bacterium]|nr:glycosyltransferase family 61 protein [Pseudomonadota bacterium]